MKKIIVIICLCFSATFYGQIDFEEIVNVNSVDAQRFLSGYLQPIPRGFGNGLSSGWYNTAKAHKLFGIDISVIANMSLIPEEGETFTFRNSDYSSAIQLDNSNISEANLPTILGSKDLSDRPLIRYTDSNGSISVSALPGFREDVKSTIGFNAVPSAIIQVGVGLWKNTDLKVRFIPEIDSNGNSASAFGIGVMHDIKQWIPFVKRLPIDVSIFAGYTNLKSTVLLDEDNNPDELVNFNTNSMTYQLLLSKKLSILTIYGGLGTTSYNSDIEIRGYSSDLDFGFDGNSFRANAGLRFKLAFLDISAEYALQEYDVFSARVGFSIR
ncbi:DUF6588 family protein [Polaribacter porphyrae]|uniref:Uncharacterized protein n=1 Tax=Polaribacter porphyrae TaxID=1137780 RepID=A0A2S7WP08_9FLAO|nr:DUF6588 family protein [Polaribacter porphyrae]PQJ79323.1 hypothetical protein BTO18_09125 [Polaribacter porphyrae]